MPNEFTLVGHHNDDDAHLLVVGADGRYYDYFPSQERFDPVEPDGRWTLFAGDEVLEDIAPAREGAQP